MKTQRDDSFWKDLGRHKWRRVKWHRSTGEAETERCAACRLPIHRTGTYYLRPAYTNGESWLCQRCYREMMRVLGRPFSRQYGRRSKGGGESDPGGTSDPE